MNVRGADAIVLLGKRLESWVFSSFSIQPCLHHPQINHMTYYKQLQLFSSLSLSLSLSFSLSTENPNPVTATGCESERAVMNIQMWGGIRAVSVWITADHTQSQPRSSVWEPDHGSYTPSDSFVPLAVTLSIKTATSVCWCRSLQSDGIVMIYLCSGRWADWLTMGKLILWELGCNCMRSSRDWQHLSLTCCQLSLFLWSHNMLDYYFTIFTTSFY